MTGPHHLSIYGFDDKRLGEATCRKVMFHLIPFMLLLYVVNQLDRVNISFASLTMNKDLAFSPEIYGFGAGIFFIGYFFFEIPSNLALLKVGVRRWMARIMLTWGIVTIGMIYVSSPMTFYIGRFLLGAAEAGFVPAMIFYLTQWIPKSHRGQASAIFILAVPLTPIIAGPLTSVIFELDGVSGLRGWQWVFVLTGLPAVLLAFVTLAHLTDRPETASWLTDEERRWLTKEIDSEGSEIAARGHNTLSAGFFSPAVLVLGLTYFSYVVGLYGITFWLPQIVRGFGLPPFEVGFVIAIPYAIAAISMVVWSRRSDRLGERCWHFALPCFVATIGFGISAALGAQVLALVSLAVALVGLMAALPIFWALPPHYLTGAAAASGIATINSLGNLGGFVGPYLVGWLNAKTGDFQVSLMSLSIGLVVAGGLAFVLRNVVRSHEAKRMPVRA